MANRFARKTGNWNASDVWSDTASGTAGAQFIPGAGDVAMANSYTITVNVNATCSEVRTDTTGGATTGGRFTLADGVTLTANAYAGSSICVYYAGSSTVSLVGNATGGGSGSAYGANNAGTGTFTLTGNVTGGTSGSTFGAANNGGGTMNLTGNAAGSSNATGASNTSGTMNLTGNVTGGAAGTSYYGAVNGGATSTLAITGNAIGGTGNTAHGAYNSNTGTLTISGTATGGPGAGACGAYNASTGTLRVGRAVGNDHGPGYSTNNGNAGVYGYGTNAGGQPTTTVGGITYGAYGQSPTDGRVLYDPNYDASATAILIRETTYAQITCTGPSNTSADPAEADVRYGTSYRFGAKTGTCRVPGASSVLTGVLVDHTTGTAAVGASDIRAAVGLASANLDTQLAAIKAKTDNLPASPAAVGSAMTLTSDYDSAKSAASSSAVAALNNLSAQQVWEYITRTLTSGGGGGGGATAQEVWEYATRGLTDKAGFALTSDYDSAKTAASQSSVNAIPTTPLLAANYTPPPTVAAIRAEMDANSTRLANLDATVASRLAAAAYSAPPSVASIRAEIDSNSTKLDAAISTRLATAEYTAPDNSGIAAIKSKTDNLPASPASSGEVSAMGSAIAALHDFDPASDPVARVTLVDTVTTLTNSPDVPTEAEIAAQVRGELAPELASITAMEARLAEQVPTGPVVVIALPAAGQTTAWALCYDPNGAPEAEVVVSIKIIAATGTGGAAYDDALIVATSDEDGLVQAAIPRGAGLRFAARRGAAGQWVRFNGVDADTLALPRLIGAP